MGGMLISTDYEALTQGNVWVSMLLYKPGTMLFVEWFSNSENGK